MDVVARIGDYQGGTGSGTGSSGRGQVGWGFGCLVMRQVNCGREAQVGGR